MRRLNRTPGKQLSRRWPTSLTARLKTARRHSRNFHNCAIRITRDPFDGMTAEQIAPDFGTHAPTANWLPPARKSENAIACKTATESAECRGAPRQESCAI